VGTVSSPMAVTSNNKPVEMRSFYSGADTLISGEKRNPQVIPRLGSFRHSSREEA
jgi:hypothetical protein